MRNACLPAVTKFSSYSSALAAGCALAASVLMAVPVQGQTEAWFGIQLPPAAAPGGLPVAIGDRGPAPAVVPVGEADFRELEGRRIAYDLDRIVDFSRQSLQSKELGGDQLWGRVSGFYSGETTVRWAAERLLDAGIKDVLRNTIPGQVRPQINGQPGALQGVTQRLQAPIFPTPPRGRT